MNIEIVEFYPLEWNENTGFVSGTLKARLPEQEIIIMGIFVSRSKGRYFFSMPGRMGIHHETGEKIRYPAVVFEDHEKQKALVEAIREKGKTFIEARLVDTERPLVLPQKPQPAPAPLKLAVQGKGADAPQKAKENTLKTVKQQAIASTAKPASFTKLATLEFRDPPKKTEFSRNSSKFARR